MSTRQLSKLTMGALGTLLLAAIGLIATNAHQQSSATAQVELATRQQMLVQTMVAQTDSLATCSGRTESLAARAALGQTVLDFDRGLGALLSGGTVPMENGRTDRVKRTRNAGARRELEKASQLWLETGVPIGDLASGQYSVFSAAGQQAVSGLRSHHIDLMQHMAAAASSLQQASAARSDAAAYARRAATGLAMTLVGMGFGLYWQTRRTRRNARVSEKIDPPRATLTPPAVAVQPREEHKPAHRVKQREPRAPYLPSIDFDNVNAAVDQMSVDMNTIAGSTEKMRQAIDSVGFALQGMLTSLNELAQDTAEGHRIVRGANNAASFAAEAAAELVDSAREMSRIVGKVMQLSQRTRQVAAQIEGEALHTGRTGEAFTSVVAKEVRGLAKQTNQATQEVDRTVSEVLVTARQYEEAISQIIKNVTAINKVSQNLGQLMLDPPPRVHTAEPVTPAPEPAPAAPVAAPVDIAPMEAAPSAPVLIEDDSSAPNPTPAEVAQRTSEAISAVATAEIPTAPMADEPVEVANGTVFLLGKPRQKPTVAEVLGAEPEVTAIPETVTKNAPVAEIPAAPAPVPEPPAPRPDGGSNNNVFLLNKPKTHRTVESTVPEAAAPVEAPAVEVPAIEVPADEAPADEILPTEPAPTKEALREDEDGKVAAVFALQTPRKKAEPAAKPEVATDDMVGQTHEPAARARVADMKSTAKPKVGVTSPPDTIG